MNVILLEDADFESETCATVKGRRLAHLREILGKAAGDALQVGRIGGLLGQGRVVRIDESLAQLEVTLDTPPPAPLPTTLVLALPRPPSLRKVLQQATAMGVKRFVLLGTRRVEKSYWQSRVLRPAELREQLLLGLEQSRDTVLPTVEFERTFKPFVEDVLPALLDSTRALVADPGGSQEALRPDPRPTTLVIGPEGGFVPHELERLQSQGATLVGLGERALRVETAVVALLARVSA